MIVMFLDLVGLYNKKIVFALDNFFIYKLKIIFFKVIFFDLFLVGR